MVDLSIISGVLSSLKTATDIAKFLRESDLSLEKAELKLKLADLIGSLADAKIQTVEIQEDLQNKDKRIAELEEAFGTKDDLVRHLDAYYTVNEAGKPVGIPYCLKCWESDHKKHQLVFSPGTEKLKVCTICGHQYRARHALRLATPETQCSDNEPPLL
jgi:hypothetical protein